ncbi:hypothetical protein CEY16_02380 [Halalkalibacillus sediminis]|uniref:Flagellar hook-length control protein-like C-terminal domain-containing protein n=1 Tax=Halalkalibacillus sediminis TaxID=2018042 RepID=A0A2I0QWA2_9BACI|nr:flagellar hook-length control protein FliK [Halalkalibacillus sediminis]PKR78623.1 hypothetical protein CEY16_02380 [Halalkalibacillus sediminis]
MNGAMLSMPMMQAAVNNQSMNSKVDKTDDKQGLFQSVFQQINKGGEIDLDKIDASKLKELEASIVEKLKQLVKDLEGNEVSTDLMKQLVNDLQQLLGTNEGQAIELIEQVSSTIDDSLIESGSQMMQLIAMLSMQQAEQTSGNSKADSKFMQQAEVVITKLLSQIAQQSNGKETQQLFNTKLDNLSQFQSISSEMVQKWRGLLEKLQTKLTSNNFDQQSLQSLLNQSNGKQSSLESSIRQLLQQDTVFQKNQSFSQQLNNQPILLGSANGQEKQDWIMPMSKSEQFTIHMTRAQGTQQTSQSNQQQMIEQLQKIVQSSKFGRVGGAQQLTVHMKPENLGNMMLKFTQINGEMAVKITVMSQAAKEMLEGNLNQLRQMFSPNQVVIERQVDTTNTDYTQEYTDEETEQQAGQGDSGEQEQQDSSESSERSFKDYLFQEEV